MTATARRLLIALVALLLLALAACGGEPSPRRTTTPAKPSASASPSSSPGGGTGRIALPDPGEGARLGWKPELNPLPGGRSYYIAVPTCTGSPGCKAWLATPRKLVIWRNAPVEWGREPAGLVVRKGAKAILSTPPGRWLLRQLAAGAERVAPRSAFNWWAYDIAVAVAIYQGVREGLRRYEERPPAVRPTVAEA